jgi:hypothetical protein
MTRSCDAWRIHVSPDEYTSSLTRAMTWWYGDPSTASGSLHFPMFKGLRTRMQGPGGRLGCGAPWRHGARLACGHLVRNLELVCASSIEASYLQLENQVVANQESTSTSIQCARLPSMLHVSDP